MWKALLGRGLVEPADDLRATNPATHPALLDRLAADFVEYGYDWRHTITLIATSATYRRSAQTSDANRTDELYYSHSLSRPLDAEVLADAIHDVAGAAQGDEDRPRAIAIVDARQPDESLDALGRCSRDDSCDAPNTRAGGLATQLHLLNGPLLNAQVAAPNGRLQAMLAAGKTNDEIVAEFYLRALGRMPRDNEREFWNTQIGDAAAERPKRLEDFLWSLMTCREFTTNH